jgi:hypothetical protein
VNNGQNELTEPIEFLDLEHGHSISLALTSFEQGIVGIHPRTITARHTRLHMIQNALTEVPAPGTPITVNIPVLRVFGTRLDEPSPLRYWDISSKRLQADLLPRLTLHSGGTLVVKISALGEKPTKVFSVEQGG